MAVSRERKTELIFLAAEILKDASADQALREAAGTTGPGKAYPALPSQADVDCLTDLLEGTIVYFEQDHHSLTFRVTSRAK